jgi:hypothetical protein
LKNGNSLWIEGVEACVRARKLEVLYLIIWVLRRRLRIVVHMHVGLSRN